MYYLIPALDYAFNDSGAGALLALEAMKLAREKHVLFDFEGSDDDNLARFYLGFGDAERSYPAYSFNRLSAVGKAVLRLWKRLK